MNFDYFIESELQQLDQKKLLRELPPAFEISGPIMRIEDKDFICFTSNNYLGLASHPRVIEAACEATRHYGCSVTASRIVYGNMDIHQNLENALSAFKSVQSTLLFNSGYAANISILTSLGQKDDLIVCDKSNHASLIDGARYCEAQVRYFRHGDINRAAELLALPAKKKFIITDSVFSMTGDIAPLKELLELAKKHTAIIILDEAHSTGVLGESGSGLFEHNGLATDANKWQVPAIIQMGTLGKALGSFGAFVSCDEKVRTLLINRSRPFIYSTALPSPVCGAALEALKILKEEPILVKNLRDNSLLLRSELKKLGFNIPDGITPIIPIIVGDNQTALDLAAFLKQEGILVPAIRPPSVPLKTARLRISLMANHTKEHIATALSAFAKAMDKFQNVFLRQEAQA